MNIYTFLDDDQRYDCNFTLYQRPPKFIKRESGKLIILTAASFLIAFAYPIAYWALSYAQVFQLNSLKEEYTELHQTKIAREVIIKKREIESTKLIELLKFETKEYSSKKNILIKIHEIQVNYPMKAKIIAQLTQNLNRYNVKIDKLSYFENANIKNIDLHLVSSNDKEITQLVKYFTQTYHNKFKFSLQNIIYDETTQKYFSQLKVIIL